MLMLWVGELYKAHLLQEKYLIEINSLAIQMNDEMDGCLVNGRILRYS